MPRSNTPPRRWGGRAERQPGLKRLPVVILTGSDQRTDVNAAYDLGANSYVVKPETFDALTDLLKTLDLYWIAVNEPSTVHEEI